MKQVRFHPAALAEFHEAVRYYDEKQPGLGLRFIDAVEGVFAQIKSSPGRFRLVEENTRKCRVPRFPYGVLFRERQDCLEIVAVMHLRRHPDYWKGRI